MFLCVKFHPPLPMWSPLGWASARQDVTTDLFKSFRASNREKSNALLEGCSRMQMSGRSRLPLGSWTLEWAPGLTYLLPGVLDIIYPGHQLSKNSLFLFSSLFLSLKWYLCP